MAARCIPTRQRWHQRAAAALSLAVRRARLLLLRTRLVCALHALRTAQAYGDRDGWASYWLDHIDDLTREIRAIENT